MAIVVAPVPAPVAPEEGFDCCGCEDLVVVTRVLDCEGVSWEVVVRRVVAP